MKQAEMKFVQLEIFMLSGYKKEKPYASSNINKTVKHVNQPESHTV